MQHYLGSWELIPELSHYSAGAPPEKGLYVIEKHGDLIRIRVSWVKDGQDMATEFEAHPDGRQMPSGFPGVDSFSLLAEDDFTLSGDARAGGKVVSTALRRVARDGTLLSVLQENEVPGAGTMRIFQVYRRT